MKKTIFSLLAFSLLFAIGTVDAQKMDKQEKKKWKKMAKEFKKNPEALKTQQNQIADLKSINQNLESQMGDLQSEVDTKDRRIAELEKQYFQALSDLESARNDKISTPPPADPNALPMGVIYRVQIGAYAQNTMPTDLDTTDGMDVETSDIQKIVLGQFRDYNKAEQLKAHLVRIGVEDAWIVSYIDGNRVSIEEAMNAQ
ncbi:MAG: hypothetical protein KDC44_14100 [Phaeodactylibacter sp.]|nr:hypothetical protein [Phaeodactylibacter sp.]